MSGEHDKLRRDYGGNPSSPLNYQERVGGQHSDSQTRRKKVHYSGDEIYRPFGYITGGSECCAVTYYDVTRRNLRGVIDFEYRTRLHTELIHMDERGQMLMIIYLADINLMITGYYLETLRERVRHRECAEIEQYCPSLHGTELQANLIADGQPIITAIEKDNGLMYHSDALKN